MKTGIVGRIGRIWQPRQTSNRPQTRARRLHHETLERRELLSVTVMESTFKAGDFTASGGYDGTFTSPTGFPPPNDVYGLTYQGSVDVTGTYEFTSPTQAVIEGSATGSGTSQDYAGSYGYNFTGHGSGTIDGTTLAGEGFGDTFAFTGEPAFNLGAPYAGPHGASGTFDPSNFSAEVSWDLSFGAASTQGSWSGDVAFVSNDPFDVGITSAALNQGELTYALGLTGPPITTPDFMTAIGNVRVFYANGSGLGDIVGDPIGDEVPIYWNQAGASVSVTGLPEAPDGATHLIVVADQNDVLVEDPSNNVKAVPLDGESDTNLGPIDQLDVATIIPGTAYQFTAARDAILTVEVVTEGARVALYGDPVIPVPAAAAFVRAVPVGAVLLAEGSRIDYAATQGSAYSFVVSGVEGNAQVRIANLVNHTDDTVTVAGTAGNDVMLFDLAASRGVTVNGVRYSFTDEEVSVVNFSGGEGNDTIEMRGTPGDETLEAWPDHAVFANGPGDSTVDFVVTMDGFEDLQAYASGGGTDTATLHGSENKDKLKSYDSFVRLRASNSVYKLRAKFFDGIVGDGGPGGSDIAVFNGSADNDIFRYTGADNTSQMESTGRDHRAVGFGTVIARAGDGTANVAHFTDTPGAGSTVDDVFYFKSHKTKLVSDTVTVTARAFDEVHATASEGGFDVARIYDTPLDDHFEFAGDVARLYRRIGTELKLLYEATSFDRVKAYRTIGEDTRNVLDHTFELIENGW